MSQLSFSLLGRTALVTGGGGVLGSAMAVALAAAGARVAVLGRDAAKLAAATERIRAAGGQALSIQGDVLDRGSLQSAAERIAADLGPLDVLVHAAGGNRPGATVLPDGSVFDLAESEFDAVVDLNLKGTLLPTLVFGRSMAARGRGSIITISSMAAVRPLTRVIGYAAAKAAVDNLTRWLAVELARKHGSGLRVNAIAPGFFVTEQNRALLVGADGRPTPRGQSVLDHTPLRRFGEPDDLAGAVVWLASDASRFVTGTVIPIDGGFGAFSGV